MPVTHKTGGSIFDERVDALVNPVNCVGAMGAGLALQFKKAFPENFRAYAELCETGGLRTGEMFVFETGAMFPTHIINFPTERHYKDKSRMQYIEDGLLALVDEIERREIESIAIPALGCGLGGLGWGDVRPLIVGMFEDMEEVEVVVFEPQKEEGDECS